MIYKHARRTIDGRYGLVLITHGSLAGRLGYFDDDADDTHAVVYLYDSRFRCTPNAYVLPFSHVLRIELNELIYPLVVPPMDDRSYGWDRWYTDKRCQACNAEVEETAFLFQRSFAVKKGQPWQYWVCADCEILPVRDFRRLLIKNGNVKS